jgi:hypothetical protein
VREREDNDVLTCNLVRDRKRESIENGNPPVWSILPLLGRFGKEENLAKHSVDLLFKRASETGCSSS